MLTRRIIPCLDVRDGRVVKGVRFQNLRDAGDPAALAEAYQEQGADELTLLDVSATPEGRRTAATTVASVRRVLSIPLTVGGGIRTVDDAARLLDAGVLGGLDMARRFAASAPERPESAASTRMGRTARPVRWRLAAGDLSPASLRARPGAPVADRQEPHVGRGVVAFASHPE